MLECISEEMVRVCGYVQGDECVCVCVCVCGDCVAKWLKHLTVNRKITGSSPTSYHRRKLHLAPNPLGTWLRLGKDKTTGCA